MLLAHYHNIKRILLSLERAISQRAQDFTGAIIIKEISLFPCNCLVNVVIFDHMKQYCHIKAMDYFWSLEQYFFIEP